MQLGIVVRLLGLALLFLFYRYFLNILLPRLGLNKPDRSGRGRGGVRGKRPHRASTALRGDYTQWSQA
jgi:hypothetical protein